MKSGYHCSREPRTCFWSKWGVPVCSACLLLDGKVSLEDSCNLRAVTRCGRPWCILMCLPLRLQFADKPSHDLVATCRHVDLTSPESHRVVANSVLNISVTDDHIRRAILGAIRSRSGQQGGTGRAMVGTCGWGFDQRWLSRLLGVSR